MSVQQCSAGASPNGWPDKMEEDKRNGGYQEVADIWPLLYSFRQSPFRAACIWRQQYVCDGKHQGVVGSNSQIHKHWCKVWRFVEFPFCLLLLEAAHLASEMVLTLNLLLQNGTTNWVSIICFVCVLSHFNNKEMFQNVLFQFKNNDTTSKIEFSNNLYRLHWLETR